MSRQSGKHTLKITSSVIIYAPKSSFQNTICCIPKKLVNCAKKI